MSLSEQINIGARIYGVQGTSNLAISQTTATAATTQDGLTIDRTLLGRRYYSCKAIAAFGYVAATTGNWSSSPDSPGCGSRAEPVSVRTNRFCAGTAFED